MKNKSRFEQAVTNVWNFAGCLAFGLLLVKIIFIPTLSFLWIFSPIFGMALILWFITGFAWLMVLLAFLTTWTIKFLEHVTKR